MTKLLRITETEQINLDFATTITEEGGDLRFYIPAVEMQVYFTDIDGLRIETGIVVENDMTVWVEPSHPAYNAIKDWLTANSF
jgi:hypothetical protein